MRRRPWLPLLFLVLGALGAAGIAVHFALDQNAFASTANAQVWAPTYEVDATETGRITAWSKASAGGAVATGERLGEIQGAAGRKVLSAPNQGDLVGDFGYVGALVQQGQELALLADLRRPYVLAYIDEGQAGRLQVGQKAHVRFADDPGLPVTGKVAQIYPAVAEITWPLPSIATSSSYQKSAQWVPVRVEFPSGASVPKYVGMSASVRVEIGGGGS